MDPASQHPTDALIRGIISGGESAMADAAGRIFARLASAPFDPRELRARACADLVPSLDYHVAKRIAEGQWSPSTSAVEYLDDLRGAARTAGARLAVYRRRAGAIAAVVASTNAVVPPEHQGDSPLPPTLVIYSADRGIILTGYQISRLEASGWKQLIPEDARGARARIAAPTAFVPFRGAIPEPPFP